MTMHATAFALAATLTVFLSAEGGKERLNAPEGRRLSGRLAGDERRGFRFRVDGGAEAIPLASGMVVESDPKPTAPASAASTFHVLLGRGQKISGRLAAIDSETIRVDLGAEGRPVVIARAGARGLSQRPGEVQVLAEGFESLDPARWSKAGSPAIVEAAKLVGSRGLSLPAGRSEVVTKLAEAVVSGRLDLAFHDDGRTVDRQRFVVELTFRSAGAAPEVVRAVLGWGEETLAVESPDGPTLALQRLTRRAGWRRLSVRFGPEGTDVGVDGDELAHGDGTRGALAEIRLATESGGEEGPPKGLAARVDDLRLARRVEPIGRPEVDPTQDEVLLLSGDQLFGKLVTAGPERLRFEVGGKPIDLSWGEAAGVHFRRAPAVAPILEGLLVRVDWTSGDSRGADRIEGVLATVDDREIQLSTPYAGRVSIPRDGLRRLQVIGPTRRVVLDAHPYHLGNRLDRDLDPPQPEGGVLERPFTLPSVPSGSAHLVLDVEGVVPERGDPTFSAQVKEGFLITEAELNGQRLGTLNALVRAGVDGPQRIRMAVPDGLLRAGENSLRLSQAGAKGEPNTLDNLGVPETALEFDRP